MFDEEYTVPEEIKAKFTDEFCKALRRALFHIFEYYDLSSFAESGPIQNCSSTGFVTAFWTACIEIGNEELFRYWEGLTWYESDVFTDTMITYMMDHGYLLGYLEDVIEEKLGIPKSELKMCYQCGRYYTEDMGREVDMSCDGYEWGEWVCHSCADGAENNYYRQQYRKMEEWRKEHENATETQD